MEQLQNILSQEPSKETWEQLIECLDNWPDFPSLSAAVDYAEQQLEEWPDSQRIPPQRQWQAIQDGAPLPSWWRLIRHLQLGIDDNILDPFPEEGLENITSIKLMKGVYFSAEELKLLGWLDKLGTLRSSDLKKSLEELLEDEDEYIDEIWDDIEDQVSDLPSIDTVPVKYWKEIREGERPIPQWWKMVRHLELGENDGELSPIAAFTHLASLDISNCHLISIEPLEELTNLTSLKLVDDLIPFDIEPIANLTNLLSLRLSLPELTDVNQLAKLNKLEDLDLSYGFELTNIEGLAALKNLKRLNLEECRELSDLTPLSELTRLKYLDLNNCESLSDLSPLASLHQLDYLNLFGCDRITDLSPLANLQSLTTLELTDCDRISDLSSLRRSINYLVYQ